MDLQKFSPWNWFKSESNDERGSSSVPMSSTPSSLMPMMRMHQELDRWMDETLRQFGMPSFQERLDKQGIFLRPSVDIAEQDKEYVISVEVPGVEEKDLTLSLEEYRLVIMGEKRQESSHEEGRAQRVERSYGSFRRVLDLPGDARVDEVKASFKNGVLKISVPRDSDALAQRREISIESH